MTGRAGEGSRLVTRAELDRLVEQLRERFAALEGRVDRTDGNLDALERHVKPYGDGGPNLDLSKWERRVDAKRRRR